MINQDQLKAALVAADEAYYNRDNPVISDSEYDKLTQKWQQLTGDKWMQLGQPSAQLTRIPHLEPMQSLEKVRSIPELAAWGQRANGLCIITPKVDGLSGELRYDAQGQLVMGVSRGDGTVGEAVLHSLGEAVRSGVVPGKLHQQLVVRGMAGHGGAACQVRGEIYLPKDKLAIVGGANCRNVAAGLVRRQSVDPRQAHLRYIAYGLSGPAFDTWNYHQKLNWLHAHGFEVPLHFTVEASRLDTLNLIHLHPDHWAGELTYEIDGVVITYNDRDIQTTLGTTSRFPKWACAFKFETPEAETTLLAIEWSANRSGVIVPVYIFQAVHLCGTTVTRATGHNLGAYLNLGARVGDRIVVRKANEIIPEVVRVVRSGV